MPLRMSVRPTASHTRTPLGTGIIVAPAPRPQPPPKPATPKPGSAYGRCPRIRSRSPAQAVRRRRSGPANTSTLAIALSLAPVQTPVPAPLRNHATSNRPTEGGLRRSGTYKQRVAELFEFASCLDLHLTGAASRDLLEVSELDLECECAAANTRALAIPPNVVDDFLKRITRGFVGEKIGGKRVLCADGFSYPIGADGPLIDATRSPVIVEARFPEMLLQKGLGLRPQVEPGFDAQPGHLLGCRRSDAVKLPHRQGLDEYWPHLGRDDEEPVRLAVIRGKFG